MGVAVEEPRVAVAGSDLYVPGEYFRPIPGGDYRFDYDRLLWDLDHAIAKTPEGVAKKRSIIQWYCLNDLFFLGYFALELTFLNHPWLVERAKEVEQAEECERTLELWAREHFKTTLRSIVQTIQYTLKHQNRCQSLFSHSRPMAKQILKAIKAHLESDKLVALFPHVLWKDTSRAESWGLDSGLTVQRTAKPRNASIEAWGLVDAMPTGGHFHRRVVDDLVDPDGVTNPDQIKAVRDAFQMSHNLAADTIPGITSTLHVVGTPYSYADLYSELQKDSRYVTSRHTVYGERESKYQEGVDGVLLSAEKIRNKLIDNGPYIFASQQLLNPTPDSQKKFQSSWVQYYHQLPNVAGLNVYIIGDPANTKKSKDNHNPDFTSMWVFGVAPRGFRYLLDGAYGRYSLPERWKILKGLVTKWDPRNVGWEQYGKDTEIETFEGYMDLENFRFNLTALNAPVPKPVRIEKWLLPKMYALKWLFPVAIWADDAETNKKINLIEMLVNNEMLPWPLIRKDDMLDGLARAEDPKMGLEEPRDFGSSAGGGELAVVAAAAETSAEVPGL